MAKKKINETGNVSITNQAGTVDEATKGLTLEEMKARQQGETTPKKAVVVPPKKEEKKEEDPTYWSQGTSTTTSHQDGLAVQNSEQISGSSSVGNAEAKNEFDYQKAKENVAPVLDYLQQSYGIDPTTGKADPNYWYKALGIDPNQLKAQREADAATARARAKASAISQTFMAANDLFGNLIGAHMPKRDKDNTAKEQNENARQLREMVAAEDAARIADASKRQQAYGNAAAAAMQKAIMDTATRVQSNTQDQIGKTAGTTTNETSSDATQTTNSTTKQYGDRYANNNQIRLLEALLHDGYITDDQVEEVMKKIGLSKDEEGKSETSTSAEGNEQGGAEYQQMMNSWRNQIYGNAKTAGPRPY